MSPVTLRVHSVTLNLDRKGGAAIKKKKDFCFFKLMQDVAGAFMRERSRVSLFRGENSIFYPRGSSSSARIPPSVQILDFSCFVG